MSTVGTHTAELPITLDELITVSVTEKLPWVTSPMSPANSLLNHELVRSHQNWKLETTILLAVGEYFKIFFRKQTTAFSFIKSAL